jgi:hypothetical protein
MWQWISVHLLLSFMKKWRTEHSFSLVHAFYACSFHVIKPALPNLPFTVHVSNQYWWLVMPTAAHNRVWVLFALFKFFHVAHPYTSIIDVQSRRIQVWTYQHNMFQYDETLILHYFNPFTPRLNPPVRVPQPRFFSGHLISNACS